MLAENKKERCMMSDRIDNINLSLDELRSLVLDAFKKTPQTQYLNICNEVANIAVEKEIVINPRGNIHVYGGSFSLCGRDEDRVREIVWI